MKIIKDERVLFIFFSSRIFFSSYLFSFNISFFLSRKILFKNNYFQGQISLASHLVGKWGSLEGRGPTGVAIVTILIVSKHHTQTGWAELGQFDGPISFSIWCLRSLRELHGVRLEAPHPSLSLPLSVSNTGLRYEIFFIKKGASYDWKLLTSLMNALRFRELRFLFHGHSGARRKILIFVVG